MPSRIFDKNPISFAPLAKKLFGLQQYILSFIVRKLYLFTHLWNQYKYIYDILHSHSVVNKFITNKYILNTQLYFLINYIINILRFSTRTIQ
ncbi:hypothetical protein S091751_2835 [Staphylococcus aureus subsp. aureus 091751]|nr:hypothetical protein S091751_2835 [Staphylococcus aureus subsp. aureus 091751]